MAPEEKASEAASACPDRDTLADFCRGRLADESLDGIAEHISLCPRCSTLLEAMQSGETILSHLRRPAADKPLVDEALCQRIAENARALGDADPLLSTVSQTSPPESEPGPPLPAGFGPYLLLQRLGQGGMGVVYKARQESLKRLVAVKMIRAGMYANNEERQRFRREGEAIARIRHTHVVQIYEFGEHEGQPYFSMELLEGGTLSGRLRSGALPQREAAELVHTLSQAVAAAHEQGIVHRDLKPGNVLFAADGTAKITDFGLAKILDGENSETLSDAILGTPVYMAPEQARGESRQIGPATDVYALGAILYETLTGHAPFGGGSRSQTLEQVREEEPEPPSRRCRGLSRDLEAICLKCLEKEPSRRYSSAAALADDLGRWLGGRTTHARPLRWYSRTYRSARRHPAIIATLCVLVLLAGLLFSFAYLRDPQRKMNSLQSRLRRGETIALIGEKGGPTWSRWSLRHGVLSASAAGGDVFTISCHNPALLQLLSDPQRAYRLRAQVRHDDGSRQSEVGLFFLHSEHDSDQSRNHCFCTLTFNDREALHPQAGQRCSLIHLNVCRTQDPASEGESTLAAEYFTPAALSNPGDAPWRELAVEARTDEVAVFWQGERFARIPRTQIRTQFRTLLTMMVEGRLINLNPNLHPSFDPRGALGLYVSHGKASFRHVEVQPLEEP